MREKVQEKRKDEIWVPSIDSGSKPFQEYARFFNLIRDAYVEDPDLPRSECRRMFEHWGDSCQDPKGVDYIEVDAQGIECIWAIPKGCIEDRVIISMHGGAYANGSMYSHRKLYAQIAKAANCRAIIVNYRRIPENPWPAPLDDCFTVYKWLLQQGIQGQHIAFTGDSAGGALSISVPMRIRDEKLPMAGACMPISPWGDLEASGPTYLWNTKDIVNSASLVKGMGADVVGPGGDLHNPYAAPIYATDLTGLPPMYIQVGGYESFLDDARVIAENARNSGIDVKLEIVEEMQHSFQMLAGYAPEADQAICRLAMWLKRKLALT